MPLEIMVRNFGSHFWSKVVFVYESSEGSTMVYLHVTWTCWPSSSCGDPAPFDGWFWLEARAMMQIYKYPLFPIE